MKLIFHIWRQKDKASKGRMARYEKDGLNPDMSMLEALDVLNEELILKDEDPITFEHDCREGICGSCGFVINGIAHGPLAKTTVCQLTLRHFKNGQELYLEPWRAKALPPSCATSWFRPLPPSTEVISSGGYISVPAGAGAHRRQHHSWSTKTTPTAPWTPPPASAAEPA